MTSTAWQISGNTRLYAHLAHPSAHVRTPQVLNAEFAARGIDAAAVSVDVAPEDLPALVGGLRGWRNLAGLGVTMPHKQAVVPLLDSLSPSAARIGAVNVIRRDAGGGLHGTNSDGLGFVRSLLLAGHAVSGQRVLLLGAGGAGRAIAFALLDAGVTELTIANRDQERARELVAALQAVYPGASVACGPAQVRGHRVVVNATSLGQRADQPLPVDPAGLDPHVLVADIVMSPPVTPLLEAAGAAGSRTHPGLPMLQCQVDLVIEWLRLAAASGRPTTAANPQPSPAPEPAAPPKPARKGS